MISEAYLLGLFIIVFVAFIWSASSLLTQYLYSDHEFRSPFLLTYIGVSLFSLWLPSWYVMHLKEKGVFDPYGIELPTESPPRPRSRQPSEEELNPNSLDENMATNYFRSSPAPSFQEGEMQQQEPTRLPQQKWTHYDHFYAAIRIAPVWFAAN